MTKNITSNTPIQDLGYSPDAHFQRQAELMELIRQVAPEVMADNQINLEKLKELLGQEFITTDEHYELNWAGKSAARREIQKTSSLTLRPDANNPPNAQHMLIEGENLEVLRVLQKSYYGKINMIYIDPPYNTGNDSFVYPDDYSETLDQYQKRTGEKNEAGYLNKQSLWKKNSKESGQYHSAWLSMMYPRLYLARNLLSQDGVIFISIDDNEAANLKNLCDEIFGSENFISQLTWEKKKKGSFLSNSITSVKEYIFVYCNSISNFKGLIGEINSEVETYPCINASNKREIRKIQAGIESKYKEKNYFLPKGSEISDTTMSIVLHSDLIIKNGMLDADLIIEGNWRYSQDAMQEYATKNELYITRDLYLRRIVSDARYKTLKDLLPRVGEEISGTYKDGIDLNNLFSSGWGSNEDADEELRLLLGFQKLVDYPKPVRLLEKLFASYRNSQDFVVLDFFAGSATTSHAVMQLNVDDGGNRQSICVQMPEPLAVESEAYKVGYRTISDISRARIGKVIAKLKAEHPDKTQDLACAHFTLAPSNFKVWRGDVNDAEALREQLAMFKSAEKTGQNQQANAQTYMLTELLLKHGLGALGVHAIAKPRQLAGVTVHRVLMADDKTMWLCFETYTDALKEEIVKAMPAQVVMLNSCFVGKKADEQLSNLQLELTGLDIALTVI